jgi:arsenate reductase (thioredoxin)
VITVLFACIRNAGRSQIAAALFNQYADPNKAQAISAGTDPATAVHPDVVEVMNKRGVDLAGRQPQKLTEELASTANWLITMGCGDQCPIVPGVRRDDWPILDPKDQPLETVNAIVEDVDHRVRRLTEQLRVSRQPQHQPKK